MTSSSTASNGFKKVRVFVGRDMTESEFFSIGPGAAAVYSSRMPGSDSVNEDVAGLYHLSKESAVLVVADGAGGRRSGEQASRLALKCLLGSVKEAVTAGGAVRGAILNGFEEANKEVQALGNGALTTMAVVEINGDQIRPYHVGDSIILALGQRGKIKLQTVSHSPVGYAVESGMLDEEEAMHHEERHIVSNMIGAPDMRIEIGPTLTLSTKDTVLLGSDGLSDNLHTDEIVELIRKGTLDQATEILAGACSKRMLNGANGHPSHPDDLTLIAFRREN